MSSNGKKIQENPIPEEHQHPESTDKPKDTMKGAEKTQAPAATPLEPIARVAIPTFTKTPPNELYRRLLPAVLFLLTFVTVMTMLLIYMDTVALGARQFRANMSRDYELARIGQESAALVAFVRQLHLQPPRRPTGAPGPPAPPTPRGLLLRDRCQENCTFVEWLPRGPRDPTTLYLEGCGWQGVAVRAAPRDFLTLKGSARPLHACLSPTEHPREVTYPEAEEGGDGSFRSRVLCLPLYTVLAAARARAAHYLLLATHRPLALLPYHRLALQMIELRTADEAARNATTKFLLTKNYTVAAVFDDGIMYELQDHSRHLDLEH